MRCNIRRALAVGKDPVTDSAVFVDTGDALRLLIISAGVCTGEPSEDIEGADGGEVAAGTEAR